MPEENERTTITILCDEGLKQTAKKAALDQGYKLFNDAYVKIFELGLEQFTKGGN